MIEFPEFNVTLVSYKNGTHDWVTWDNNEDEEESDAE